MTTSNRSGLDCRAVGSQVVVFVSVVVEEMEKGDGSK